MMKRFLFALGLFCISLWVMADDFKNPLFDEWVKEGIKIPDGPVVKLPAPLIEPGKGTKIDEALLEKAADRVPLELFLRRSVTAPLSLRINSIEKDDQQRCGQMISLRFVAYGKLETVTQTDVIKQLLTGKEKAKGDAEKQVHVLSPEELNKRGITVVDTPTRKESYATMSMSLLDKVQIEGVTRGFLTSSAQGVIYATRMDDRFKNDKDYPNRWRAILREKEEETLGPPQPYTGLGGYVVVTALPEPKDALLVEMHFVFNEPPEWFGGLNLLRSKLPTPIQENVRAFRRRLEK
jgi:hypothetical protein